MSQALQTADKSLEDMMLTINQLFKIYELETEALERVDTKTFLALQDEKIATARLYQSGMQNLLERKNEMRKAAQPVRARFEQMQADFSVLSRKNMEALSRMQRTMERLGGTLRKAAKDATKKQRALSYGANGIVPDDDKRQISMGVSETA
ncbi:MAG: hypothetical protein IT559_06240 [Alphaproteobacteria bacterium]|nr:hypothetical protein [Alphaproteobacteria bacterium]